MARTAPTIVATSPIARWRKPPTLAFAYISPARSSKRRMSIIVSSHSFAAAGSGRPWAPRLAISSRVTSIAAGTVARLRRSAAVPAPPLGEELLGLELRQVGAQRAREAARLRGQRVPEERDLAGGDLDDLDVVDAPGAGEQRGGAALAAHDQLVLAVGLHRDRSPAAASSSRSPWNTRPPATTAGTSHTPAAAACAVASSTRSAIDRSAAPFVTAAGCISHAAAAISTISSSQRS